MLCGMSALLLAAVAALAGGNLLFGWLGALVGFFIPYAYASHLRSKRFHKFEEKFPEAIDTLARAVRAGHAFTTAVEMIANEVGEPVASEFRQLFEEQKFGLPVRDALMNLTERVPLVDVKFFVTAVMLQRETGGNLAEILDNLSYVIRERFKILRQVRVHTAQGRLTMVLLMALPPTIVVVMQLLNPGFIHPLFADPLGHALIVGGIALQTMGYFVIRKIIRIRV
jgi:tight adherence protein B